MVVEVAADVATLEAFIAGSEALRLALSARLADLDHLDHRVRAGSSAHVAGPSSLPSVRAHLARLAATEALTRRVRAELVAADDTGAIVVDGSSLLGAWSSHLETVRQRRMATELVGLVARRGDLERVGRLIPEAGRSNELASITARIAELTQRLSIIGWRHASYLEAGIDPRRWDPEGGLAPNDDTVQSVYRYYADLYEANTDLRWAGLAALVGPLFYAGFQDLYTLRHVIDDGDRVGYLGQLLGGPKLPGIVYDVLGVIAALPVGGSTTTPVHHLTAENLDWLERKLLAMQREIFDDMAWMHVAYLHGGLGVVTSLLPGDENEETREAWAAIGTGDPSRLQLATEALARREQGRIIQDDYDEIIALTPPVGLALTLFMTWTAVNPIPGGRPYRDVVERDVAVSIPTPRYRPGGPFGLQSDLGRTDVALFSVPQGNVAVFEDRWEWIENDMLPSFERLVTHEPEVMRGMLERPVAERADELRLSPLPYPR